MVDLKNQWLWSLAFVWLSVFCLTVSSIPIPPRYDGFVFNSSTSPTSSSSSILLEAFFDPLCSDSADAWPVIKAIANYYSDDLTLIVHPFPLPYHHNAFFACRALHIINNLNSSLTYSLLELFFNNQDSFSTSATADEAPSSVINRITSLVVENLSDLPSEFEASFKAGFSEWKMDLATRISFKFGCSRVVVGTPYYFLNGIPLYDADSWSFSQWASTIDNLLSDNFVVAQGHEAPDHHSII